MRHSWIIPLPYAILCDKGLTSTAKLVAAEIFALISFEKGYCFASNKHFEELLELGRTTVKRSIKQLLKAGYIRLEIIKDEGNLRRVYPGNLFAELKGSFTKPGGTPLGSKMDLPRFKNGPPYNEENDNKNDNIILPSVVSPLSFRKNGENDARAMRSKNRNKVSQSEEINDLIDRMVELTDSSNSRNYYKKAIKTLGTGVVESELAETRYRTKIGSVKDSAKYLTALLQERMNG